jgi:transketolase
LGSVDIAQLRERFDWPYAPFEIPQAVYADWDHTQQGERDEQQWLLGCKAFQTRRPQDYHTFLRRINGDLPDKWPSYTTDFIEQALQSTQACATRKASQQCIEAYASQLPELLGGSADLTESNNTNWTKTIAITAKQWDGNYLHYGVREFAMSAILNGIALHGGFIPFGGTFLVFADYARNALRLSALMKQRVIYIYTHDSIGLGEDGPTHQPVEHAAMLRMTPNMQVWRPADLAETAVAWQQAIERHNGPSSLLLSRQTLPALLHAPSHAVSIARGGYIVVDCDHQPELILIATGSEVHLAIESAKQAKALGIQVRVVSMPCAERFLMQDKAYQEHVLPDKIRQRIAIEAGATTYWYRFVGLDGAVIGLDSFGQSAPAKDVYQFFGITVENILATVVKIMEKKYDITCCD